MLDDLRFAVRLLVARPGFACLAILTLAIAIAANSTIFTVVRGVLLRPLPYGDADRLVALRSASNTVRDGMHSGGDYLDFVREQRSFSGLAAFRLNVFTLLPDGGRPLEVVGAWVTSEFFDVLDAPTLAGRRFQHATDQATTDSPVIIAERVWRAVYGADPSIVGRRIRLNGNPHTLAGVMPSRFSWPATAEVWVLSPHSVPPSPLDVPETNRDVRYFQVVGRLSDGISLAQARDDTARVAADIRTRGRAGVEGRTLELRPLADEIVGDVRPAILVMQWGVVAVLLIACANVSGLLIARTLTRGRELAVRAALGATRARLVRQLLTESLVIGVVGGLLGLLGAQWLVAWVRTLLPADVPRAGEISIDGLVALVTMVAATMSSVVVGAMPAMEAGRARAAGALKAGGERGSSGRAGGRSALVVAEIALTIVLLATAGLLARSLAGMLRVDTGFQPEHVTIASIALPPNRYPTALEQRQFFERLVARMGERRDFDAAGIGYPGPLKGASTSGSFDIEGRASPSPADRPFSYLASVSSGYFQAMGIALHRGRSFADSDTDEAPGVAIVTVSFARRYWPGEDPIGRRLRFEQNADAPWITVVGLVNDVRQIGVRESPPPVMFIPYRQFTLPFTSIAVRGAGGPGNVAEALQAIVRDLDPELPLGDVAPLATVLSSSLDEPRFRAGIFAALSGIALLLAAVGLYGLISYSVAQQTREIGIRVALGAAPGQVVGPILAHGIRLALAGTAIGLAGSLVAARAIERFLFEVTPTDPLTLLSVAGVLVAIAIVATWVPARRALSVDPMTALRSD